MRPEIKEQLKKIVKGEFFDDEKTRKEYSKDASLFEVMPDVVIFPKDVEDVKNIVKFVAENKEKDPSLSITARSAGSDMSGGPLNESIILDFTKHINNLVELKDDYAWVEPGMFFRDFEKETLKKGLIFPSYPASKSLCAIGGIVSNNSGGEKNPAYGKTENYVLELKVVLADGNEYLIKPLTEDELKKKLSQNDFEGEIYRKMKDLIEKNYEIIKQARPNVSKNSAGYYLWNVIHDNLFDLVKLIVGSQGTLALVTQAKLRLVPVKKHSKLLVVFLRDLNNLADIVNDILPYKPESLESYDDHTLGLALRFMPDIIKEMNVKNIFRFLFSFLPEARMVVTGGGLPKLILLVEFASNDEREIDEKMKSLFEKLQKYPRLKAHISKTKEESEKYWTIRRKSFALLRKHVNGKHTAPFIDDIIVQPKYLPEFLPKLNMILKKYPFMQYTIAGHVGDGNFHIIPLVDMTKKENRDAIPKIINEVFDLVLEYKGSITAEHNDGIIRTPFLKKMFGDEVVKLFEKTKNIFDPKNIFNPHKKVGEKLSYLINHMIDHN